MQQRSQNLELTLCKIREHCLIRWHKQRVHVGACSTARTRTEVIIVWHQFLSCSHTMAAKPLLYGFRVGVTTPRQESEFVKQLLFLMQIRVRCNLFSEIYGWEGQHASSTSATICRVSGWAQAVSGWWTNPSGAFYRLVSVSGHGVSHLLQMSQRDLPPYVMLEGRLEETKSFREEKFKYVVFTLTRRGT